MKWIACGLVFVLSAPVVAREKPNVLLIMADDLGFSDLGCYGGEIETPLKRSKETFLQGFTQ